MDKLKTKEALAVKNEPGQEKDTRASAVVEEPEQEQAEEKLLRSAPVKIGFASPPDIPPPNNGSRNGTINYFQKSYGNFATLRHFNYPIQTKPAVGRPDDIYEQEADRIAEQAASIPDSRVQRKPG